GEWGGGGGMGVGAGPARRGTAARRAGGIPRRAAGTGVGVCARVSAEVMSHPLPLNPAQRSAVEHPSGPLLVLAGAGSGKTRVLTERIARLVREGVAPHRILAFTFTNRAAKEMRERIERAVGEPARKLWMGTFHGTGLHILRREVRNLGPAARHPNFVVYDREDQEKVLDAIMKKIAQPPEDRGKILGRISDWKSRLMPPEEAASEVTMSFERRA